MYIYIYTIDVIPVHIVKLINVAILSRFHSTKDLKMSRVSAYPVLFYIYDSNHLQLIFCVTFFKAQKRLKRNKITTSVTAVIV